MDGPGGNKWQGVQAGAVAQAGSSARIGVLAKTLNAKRQSMAKFRRLRITALPMRIALVVPLEKRLWSAA